MEQRTTIIHLSTDVVVVLCPTGRLNLLRTLSGDWDVCEYAAHSPIVCTESTLPEAIAAATANLIN